MKYFLIYILLLLTINFSIADAPDIDYEQLAPEAQHKKVAPLIAKYLSSFHYQKKEIDDSLSSEIFNRFFDRIDPSRVYFLESDIKHFNKYRYLLDDYIAIGYLDPAYEIFNVYGQRIAERLSYVYSRLEEPFNYDLDEYLELDRENAPWFITTTEQDELWRKRLKNETLNLLLSGKEPEEIIKLLKKRYNRVKKNIEQFQSEDVFQIFMNAVGESFDPHTNYFSPKTFDDFKIQMSQAYSGIGARLTTEDDYTVIREIIPGGPAAKSNTLHVDDKIIGVGQTNDGEIVDVIGWRIDDVVQLIRGERNTLVRLQITRADDIPGTPSDTISLNRDKIKLEDQSAKGEIKKVILNNRDFNYIVIEIPQFYSDFEGRNAGEKNYKSTTHDVEKLLIDFRADTLDGVIIDLRHNGGGFLNEAIELTGLFIDVGPVVQVRSTTGKVSVEWDDRKGQVYSGPLAVVVDRISASASEIFAAAIQDYERGLIIGSQTFGKGTVQNAIGLNRFFPNTKQKLGQIKMTIAKFYRINGGSTQHVGVIPDIAFPSRFELMEIGESSEQNALLWDQIDPVYYRKYGDIQSTLTRIEVRHHLRLNDDIQYANLCKLLEEFEINRNKTRISLKKDIRKKEREKAEKRKKERKNEEDEDDLLLTESARVLSDYIILSEK